MSSGRRNEILPIKRLPKHGTIAVTSPASPPDEIKLEKGVRYLEMLGYRVQVGKTCSSKDTYLAGDDHLRANELMSFINNSKIDAIFCARGGFGTLRLLDMLDYKVIREQRKLLVGFSDITALQWAILSQANLPSVSGGMVAIDMSYDEIDPVFETAFWELINTGECKYALPYITDNSKQVDGLSMPGTLSVAAKLCGSRFFPDLRDAILIFEDIHEPSHKLEGYLQQMYLTGTLEKCSALISGSFIAPETEEYDDVPDLKTILNRVLRHSSIPLIMNFPYGHIHDKLAVPVGAHISLYLGQQSTIETRGSLYTS